MKYKKHIVLTQPHKLIKILWTGKSLSQKGSLGGTEREGLVVCERLGMCKNVWMCKVKHKKRRKKTLQAQLAFPDKNRRNGLSQSEWTENGSPALSAAMGWMESDSYSNAAVTLKATVWKGEPVSRLTECTEPFFRGALSWLRGTEGRAVMLWLSLTTHTLFPSNTTFSLNS